MERLIEREAELKARVKEVQAELKAALSETPTYKEVMAVTVAHKGSEKAAEAYALKVARAKYG